MNYRQLRFSRATNSYDSVSETQRNMAERLYSCLNGEGPFSSVLELGCGTGNFSQYLITGVAQKVLLTDSSEEMLEKCRQNLKGRLRENVSVDWRPLDALESLPAGWDLICSNALIQWLEDLDIHILNLEKALNPNGYLLISGFCKTNFPELESVLTRPPFSFHSFPGHRLVSVQTALERNGFSILHSKQELNENVFSNPESFIRHLKLLGASGKQGFTMTPRKWKQFKEAYVAAAKVDGGVKATWKPWYILARKKDESVVL